MGAWSELNLVSLSLLRFLVQFSSRWAMFISSSSFSIGTDSLLTEVYQAGYYHPPHHHPWVLFPEPLPLQPFLIASPSWFWTSWLVELHCLIHPFLVVPFFWTFFVVYLLVYHTGVLPVYVL